MSYDMFFGADLEFPSDDALAAAKDELDEEGYLDSEDNLFTPEDLVFDGNRLTVSWHGSAPATCFDIMAGLLETYARHAHRGEAVALQLEDAFGEHFRCGQDDAAETEVEGDEVQRLFGLFNPPKNSPDRTPSR